MKTLLIVFCILYVLVDTVYITASRSFYSDAVAKVQGRGLSPALDTGKIVAAVTVYALMVFGWVVFVIPTASKTRNVWSAAAVGAAFGLVVYGVFNGTIYFMFDEYPVVAVMRDVLWGSTCAAVLTGAYWWWAQ